MRLTSTHIAATEAVTVSLRLACKLLNKEVIGGLNRTMSCQIPTPLSTVASIHNHETKYIRLIILSSHAYLQINAHTRRCALTPVTDLLRFFSEPNSQTLSILTPKKAQRLGLDFITWTASLDSTRGICGTHKRDHKQLGQASTWRREEADLVRT